MCSSYRLLFSNNLFCVAILCCVTEAHTILEPPSRKSWLRHWFKGNNFMTGRPTVNVRKALCASVIFNPLHSSTNQQLFEKNLCIQSSYYEKLWMISEGSHDMLTTKSTLLLDRTQRRALVNPWRMHCM